jgi:hypothetical protein
MCTCTWRTLQPPSADFGRSATDSQPRGCEFSEIVGSEQGMALNSRMAAGVSSEQWGPMIKILTRVGGQRMSLLVLSRPRKYRILYFLMVCRESGHQTSQRLWSSRRAACPVGYPPCRQLQPQAKLLTCISGECLFHCENACTR